jgi:hypothetical protein
MLETRKVETRKVTVTATRYYSKQTTVEVDVPVEIQDDELIDFLTESEELTNQIEEGLFQDSLSADDDNIEYQDPTNNFGGHL